jgi:Protein of unknown function (DUF1360)
VHKSLSLLIDIIAVYRLTKLILDDKLTEDLRGLVFENFPRGSKMSYLFTCGWCISIWAAIGIFTLRAVSPQKADYVSSILAASAVTGVAYTRGL